REKGECGVGRVLDREYDLVFGILLTTGGREILVEVLLEPANWLDQGHRWEPARLSVWALAEEAPHHGRRRNPVDARDQDGRQQQRTPDEHPHDRLQIWCLA